jgi:protease-4
MMKRRTKRILIFLFAAFLLLAIFAIVLGALFGPPSIPDQALLVLKIEGTIPEIEERGLISELIIPPRVTVYDYTQILRSAASDERVMACLIRIRPIAEGWATVSELRRAIAEFRNKSGKPVAAVLDVGTNREIYLASAADRVFIAEEGTLLLGLRTEVPFVRGTLEKLRIEADFERVGEYKDGPEIFTQDTMSKPSREALESLVDSVYGEYKSTVVAGRPECATQDVEAAFDRSLLGADDAVKFHLVDEKGYLQEAKKYLIDRVPGGEKIKAVSADDYRAASRFGAKPSSKATFALLIAEGPIFLGSLEGGPFASRGIGSDSMVEEIEKITKDPDIDAIILRIDSPGGSMLASDIIWSELERAQQNGKTLYVSMGDTAASGGYYIAMGARHIVAEPNTITGSIGIYAGKFDLSGFYDWLGINHVPIQRGENAGFLSSVGSFTSKQREILREELESAYKTFVRKAAQGRSMLPEDMEKVAQGRVWSGSDAVTLGLVDELGGIETAIAAAKKDLGLLRDEEVRLVIYPRPEGFWATLRSAETSDVESQLPSSMVRALQWVRTLEKLQQEPLLALWPEGLNLDL